MVRKFAFRDLMPQRDHYDRSGTAVEPERQADAHIIGSSRSVERRFGARADRRQGAERRANRLSTAGRRSADDRRGMVAIEPKMSPSGPIWGSRNLTRLSRCQLAHPAINNRTSSMDCDAEGIHAKESQDFSKSSGRTLRGANLAFATQVLSQYQPCKDPTLDQRAHNAYRQASSI